MALTFGSVEGPQIGRIVYRNGQPLKLGVALRIDKGLGAVEVYWVGEKRSTMVSLYVLRDYESLVLESERKAKNHRNAYEAALAVSREVA